MRPKTSDKLSVNIGHAYCRVEHVIFWIFSEKWKYDIKYSQALFMNNNPLPVKDKQPTYYKYIMNNIFLFLFH